MEIKDVEKFFADISDEELTEKWGKYNCYSENTSSPTLTEFVEHWNNYYCYKIDLTEIQIKNQILIKETESNFGFFLN